MKLLIDLPSQDWNTLTAELGNRQVIMLDLRLPEFGDLLRQFVGFQNGKCVFVVVPEAERFGLRYHYRQVDQLHNLTVWKA